MERQQDKAVQVRQLWNRDVDKGCARPHQAPLASATAHVKEEIRRHRGSRMAAAASRVVAASRVFSFLT